LSFNGAWHPDEASISFVTPKNENCSDSKCAASLSAESLVCYGTPTTLGTYEFIFNFALLEIGCVKVLIRTTSGHAFTSYPQSPLALSFLQTNYNLVDNNTYAVVLNDGDVVVGQIRGAMIQVDVQNISLMESFELQMSPCLLLDPTIDLTQNQYNVFDVGILSPNDIIHPLGGRIISENERMICFENITVSNGITSLILIQRLSDYENFNAYTSGEQIIVYISGALFCLGGFLLIVFHIYFFQSPPILILGVQSVCLLLFRGIYFLLLGSGNIPVGGLLDFALIEIPTFVYIGIFLQIILPAYRFFFDRIEPQKISNKLLSLMIALTLLLNWIIFAAMIIAISFSTESIEETRSCNCLISDPIQQNNNAQIIRIVYKSFVLLIAIGVVIMILIFRMEAYKAGGIVSLYYQIGFLSLGLFFDCVAFVIYYAVNSPTAYFLIILWFTELLPICSMNLTVIWVTKSIIIKLWE
jgi:hypothetical protein